MLDTFVVQEITVGKAGESEAVSVESAAGRTSLLTLVITGILEQQSINVSIWGSSDGETWAGKPLTVFPQKFYTGVHQLVLDLSRHSDTRFLKAGWAVNRWRVGDPAPQFTFMIKIQEQA